MTDIDRTQAAEAASVVVAYWTALANDDADALMRVCSAAVLARTNPSAPGLAERIRSAHNVTRELCSRMGQTSQVRVLRDGSLAFSCLPSGPFGEPRAFLDGPERVFLWRLSVIREGGGWRVDGSLHDPLDIVQYVELPPEWFTPLGPPN